MAFTLSDYVIRRVCIDMEFGCRTTRAVLDFQSTKFGEGSDDGIVGPVTATALGIGWQNV